MLSLQTIQIAYEAIAALPARNAKQAAALAGALAELERANEEAMLAQTTNGSRVLASVKNEPVDPLHDEELDN